MDNDLATGYAMGQSQNANGYGYGAGMWGMEWMWIIILFAMWGGGWGNGFGNNGGNGMYAVDAAVQRGFDTNNILSKLEGINGGLCDGFYAMNTGLLTGFNGVEREISNLGYRQQDCCCQTQRAIDGVNYNMAKNTCDIITAMNAGFQQIKDMDTARYISQLEKENMQYLNQLSQNAQTRSIIDALLPVAKPAYITCSPYVSSLGYPTGQQSGYGYGSCPNC